MRLLVELVRPEDAVDDSDGVAVVSAEIPRLESSDFSPTGWLAQLTGALGQRQEEVEVLEVLTATYSAMLRTGDVSAGERAEVERTGLPLAMVLLALRSRSDLYLRIRVREKQVQAAVPSEVE